ncbi:protein of unknown function [Methanoculleus bourgensis]|jgi:hypothetical protein|uniref:Uncharacterized protein n=1 Tax=Methanoculleus bourgensis TaxID=83986 RepID=A0A0X3BKZ2_9EURY|nr:protein of unknown function [Methanoculleus bourgensis]
MNKEIFPEIVHSDQRPFAANSGSHSPPDQVPLEEPRDRVHGSVVPCVSGLAANEKIENDDLTMCRKNLGVSEFSTAKSVCAPICAPLWSTAANAANSLRLLSGVLDPGTVARVKTESPAGCDPCDHGEGSVSITGGTGEGFYTQPVRERGAREGVR